MGTDRLSTTGAENWRLRKEKSILFAYFAVLLMKSEG